ncbi:MAG: 3-hydroxyacyl-CoA dehydrogenase family protein, partial [Candidatus Anstonellales archaeon]
EEGIATKEDIDKACRIAFGHPMGPFEIFDLSGLDTVLHILSAMAEVYGERFKPNQTLINLVDSGYIGRKVGKGFYNY